MTPAAPKKPAAPYDERVYRRGHPPHRATIALIAIVLLVIGTYFAWTKELPFQHPYELKAVFSNAVNIRAKSPVRIAGVNVGEVKSVKGVGNDAEVTFTVDDAGRPIHDDAEVEIRPRIFLEGNFFLDLRPGSPSAPELASGDTIPITHTSTAVQLDEVLTSLQKPDRANLVRLLKGFGTGLNHQPTAQEDVGQDTEVQGKSGAPAINQSFRYGGAAGRDTAIVSEALQGTAPHDLSRLLRSSGATFAALLTREQQLKDLVTNFNTTMSAFASDSTTPCPRCGPSPVTSPRASSRSRPRSRRRIRGSSRRSLCSTRRSCSASLTTSRRPPPAWPSSPTARSVCCPRWASPRAAPPGLCSTPATWSSTISSTPGCRTSRSSSTDWSSSTASPRASTATVPTCASSPAAGRPPST
jgi:hypothetical protein